MAASYGPYLGLSAYSRFCHWFCYVFFHSGGVTIVQARRGTAVPVREHNYSRAIHTAHHNSNKGTYATCFRYIVVYVLLSDYDARKRCVDTVETSR